MALTSLQEALMLATLSPKSARRYLSLPPFGPVIDDFDHWLIGTGLRPRAFEYFCANSILQLADWRHLVHVHTEVRIYSN